MATGSPYAGLPTQPPAQKSNTTMILLVVLGALLLGGLICGGILVALLLPAVQSARNAARRMQSANNVKMIGLALHNYHDTHGALPPAFSTDADGQPLLSWRVALLPYVEEMPLYEQFQLDEPWDSPNNRPLLDRMPAIYRSPLAPASIPANETQYFAIRAPNSMFPGANSVTFADIADGLANTVAAVELSTMGVPWTKPDDVTPDAAYAALTQMEFSDAGHILTGDGAVQYQTGDLDQQTFLEMVSRDDTQ